MAENKISKNEFLKKIGEIKDEHKLDLSLDEDLSIAIMNLLSLEEHFFFSGGKTGNKKYYDLMIKVREKRKKLLKKIVREPEAEEWCISKHLLASSMRLIEVGTKYQAKNEKEKASEIFSEAYDLYSLFWGVNLKLVNSKEVADEVVDISKESKSNNDETTERLNKLVSQLVNCCDE